MCIRDRVYADRDTQTGGGGGSGGTGGSWSVTTKTGGEEFIRCSIWFYKGGIDVDKNPTPVGYAIDLRSPKYASLRSGTPVRFSDATENNNTARHYTLGNGRFEPGSHYYGAVMENAVPGETKEEYEANKGNATLEFPIIATADRNIEATGIDSDAYFRHFDVYNKLLWYVQANKYGDAANSNGEWQDVENMENGVYQSVSGTESGQYIILLESGVYCSINGTSAALTLRDMISLHTGPGGLLSQFADPPRNCANALYIVKDWSDSLGLNGESGENQITGHVRDNLELCKAKLGANIITFEPGEGQIPVINYYYDLTVPGGLVGTGLEDIKTVWTPILSEDTPSFDKAATTSTKVKVTGNEYKAPLISSPKEGGRQYKLVMGFMSLKDDLDGNLDIKEDWRLQFYDAINLICGKT